MHTEYETTAPIRSPPRNPTQKFLKLLQTNLKNASSHLNSRAVLDAPSPDALPIQHVSPEEVCLHIQKLHPRKAPGFDGIDSRIAKALPKKGILFLVLLFNSMLRIHHFPSQWKCTVITMIPKPGKPENLVQSYRPISLLPTFSKIFERIFLSRIMGVHIKLFF